MGTTDRPLDKYALTVDTGKIIFKEGDIGTHMYIIKSGSIKISKSLDDKELILTVLKNGDFFGEMALVSNISRTATATAVATTKLVVLNRKNFIEMVQKNGNIALNIIDKLCKRIQHTNQQLQLLAEKDTLGLFAQNLFYSFNSEDAFNNTISYLDFFRDMTLNLEIPQQSINQILESFKDKGIIDILNAKIVLLDEDKLMALAKIEKKA